MQETQTSGWQVACIHTVCRSTDSGPNSMEDSWPEHLPSDLRRSLKRAFGSRVFARTAQTRSTISRNTPTMSSRIKPGTLVRPNTRGFLRPRTVSSSVTRVMKQSMLTATLFEAQSRHRNTFRIHMVGTVPHTGVGSCCWLRKRAVSGPDVSVHARSAEKAGRPSAWSRFAVQFPVLEGPQ